MDSEEARKENRAPRPTGGGQAPFPRPRPPAPPATPGTAESRPQRGPVGGQGGRKGCRCYVTARRTLWKSPFLIPSKSRLVSTTPNPVILQVYVVFPCPRSSVPSCLPPLPRDVLALFEYELFYGGTLNINIYKERMYGQFPMVSVGCPHLVNSPQSS